MLQQLLSLLGRLELRSNTFTGDELSEWQPGDVESFVREGLLREGALAPGAVCDSCSDGHWEKVFFVRAVDSRGPRAFLKCPESGTVEVSIDRLKQWVVSPVALADALSRSAGCSGVVEEVVPERVWSLGRLLLHGRKRLVLFARGLSWTDAAEVFASTVNALRLNEKPVLLLPNQKQADVPLGRDVADIVLLRDIVSRPNGTLRLDVDIVRQLVSAPEDAPPIAADDSGLPTARSVWVYRPDGRRRYREDDKELERLRESRGQFNVFVDGTASPAVAHRVARKKPSTGKLTSAELELLQRYLLSAHQGRGPLQPIELRVSKQSAVAAAEMFKRLRSKVDVQVSRQKYCLFQQIRRFEGGRAAYEWRPDPGFDFCVLLFASGDQA
jgi:hypothetical protein